MGIATYVHKNWITCPCFTIEFKKHDESDMQARAQVVTAGALALYNRDALRERALRVARQKTGEPQVRHYALTVVGASFEPWVLQANPRGSGGWRNGCIMTKLCGSSCSSKYAIRQLQKWINEIHRWGLAARMISRRSLRQKGWTSLKLTLTNVKIKGLKGAGLSTKSLQFRSDIGLFVFSLSEPQFFR